MIMTTMETLPNAVVSDVRGVAMGNTIRSKHLGRDIGAALKTLVGGELKGYTEMLTESRNEAVQRMLEHADSMGADAVVNVRFTTSQVAGGAAEILAYGTAVTIRRSVDS
ncbi:MAG: YbjQ family protein [Actinomycetota bacterium]